MVSTANDPMPTVVVKLDAYSCKAYYDEIPLLADEADVVFRADVEDALVEKFEAQRLVARALHVAGKEPRDYFDAINGADKDKWILSCNAEFESLVKHGVAEVITSLPKGTRLMDTKCVFKIKKDKNGNVLKYKTRLTLRGFKQRAFIDYDETFAGVPRATTFRFFFALPAIKHFVVHLMDVHTAFLHGAIL